MQGNARPSLKDCLDSLTSDESPRLRQNMDVDYIILRRAHIRKEYVFVEFVDGDGKDEQEWFEGPVPELITVKTLFEMRDVEIRGERRKVYGRKKLRKEVDSDVLAGKECKCAESPNSSGGREMVVVNAVESGSANGESSKGTEEYVPDESSSAGPRRSADARKRPLCTMIAERDETRPDAGKRELRAIDSPNHKFRMMETRSTVIMDDSA